MSKFPVPFFTVLLLVLSILPAFSFAAAVPSSSSGLVGLWHFDDSISDLVAADSSVNRLSATCVDANCPTFNTSGKYSGAYQFDAADYLSVPNTVALNPTSAITIAAWVKADNWTGNRRIVQKGTSDNQYRLLAENGFLKFHLAGVTNGTLTTALPSLGAWHHIVGTYDGASIKLYVDGVVAASGAASGSIATSTSALYLATKSTIAPAGDHFKGTMDEVAIWNRALSAAEIQQLAIDAPTPVCGDNVCNGTETCSTCSTDCGTCPPPQTTCYDVTSDNKTNVLDLAYIGSKFGTSDALADVTNDGLVDVADLVLVSGNFGACTPVITPNCTIGSQITSACVCDGTTYTTGYCCSTGYSTSACIVTPLTVSAIPTSTSFTNSQTVTLSSSDATATIYYTTNGTTPTTSSSVYSTSLTFTSTTTLKFIAIKGAQQSTVATETYTKNVVPPSGNLQAVIRVDEAQWYKDNIPFPSGLSLTTGYVPFPVFFEGWESTPRDEIAEYEWSFDDDQSAYSGNPNTMKTFNAAHVFETPGTYTVTLRVKGIDGAWSAPVSKIITALARPGIVYYVDSAIGDDSYNGKCTAENIDLAANCGPWKTATKAFWYLKVNPFYNAGDSVLFKRGQEFEIAGGNTGLSFNNLLFSTYGSGNKPVINYDGNSGGWIVNGGIKSSGLSFVDLVFEMKNHSNFSYLHGIHSVAEKAKGILYLRDEFYEGDAIFGHGTPSDAARASEAVVSNIYVIDSKNFLREYDNLINGTGNVPMYGYLARVAVINSEFDLANEQIAYFTHLNKSVISGSKFSRPPFGRPAIRISGHLVNGKGSNNIHIADNYFMGWVDPLVTGCGAGGGSAHQCNSYLRYTGLLLQIGPNTSAFQSQENITVERNIFTNFETALQVTNGENITIRNNLFVSPAKSSGSAIDISPLWATRPVKTVKIIGNTMFRGAHYQGNNDARVKITPYYNATYPSYNGQTQHEGIVIMNNIMAGRRFSDSGGSSPIWIVGTSLVPALMSQLTINNNLYDFPYTTNIGKAVSGYDLNSWRALDYNYDLNSIKADSGFAQTLNVVDHQPLAIANTLDGGRPSSLAENVALAEDYKQMFRLSTTSPAIDKGSSLYPADMYYDFTGIVARPLGNGYDIGAYESG
jgi:hypothetical protein